MRELIDIRSDLPALSRLAYFNTGTAGPLPLAAGTALSQAMAEDVERGRVSGKRYAKIDALLAQTRSELAALTGARPDEICLTSGTLDGIELVLDHLMLSAGQRIVTTDLEHPAALDLVQAWSARHGIEITIAKISDQSDEQTIGTIATAADGAALVLVSHVCWSSGRVLPIAGIAGSLRGSGVELLVDGAQAVGSIPVDFASLGAGYYAFPGQKWLMGPEGTGALIVARESFSSLAGKGTAPQDAAAFERGTKAKPIWAALSAALGWRREQGNDEDLLKAGLEIASAVRQRLAALPFVRLATAQHLSGLVAFAVEGLPASDIVAALGARRIAARDIPGTDLVRVSCGFFTSPDEVDALIDAVANLKEGRS